MTILRKMEVTDASDNIASLHLQTDGDYHLGTTMTQSVDADSNNSSTTNLSGANSYTFTGTATSTLGVVGLQWNLKTDQNATIYIEQSVDDGLTNWDVSDSFDYLYAKGGAGDTVEAINAYWRIRVILTGTTDTTYFRLAGILCPIALPLPRTLSNYGNLQTVASIRGDENTDRHVWVNPTSELAISPVYRLVGTTFDGSTLDDNFWIAGVLNDGTVTQMGGYVALNTSATASGSAELVSVRKARFVAGSALKFTCAVTSATSGTVGNIRRIGAYDDNDGFFFEFNGSNFKVGSRAGGSETTSVSSGDFNGNLGNTWTPTIGTPVKLQIEYTPLAVCWYVGNKLLHKKQAAKLSETMTLPITIENINGAITTDVLFECFGAYIARQGELESTPISKRITTANTYVCKRGAGVLKRVVLSSTDDVGETISMYDNASGAGTVIGVITMEGKATAPVSLEYGVPFHEGLTIISAGVWDALIVYE